MAPVIDQRRLHPRLTATDLATDAPPFVPELTPVVDARGNDLMTRPWLDWARRLTLVVQSLVTGSGGGGGGGTGDVVGPAGAINTDIAVYDGTTGKLIKDSLKTIAQVITDAVNQAIAAILPGGKLPVSNLPLHKTTHQAGGVDAVDVTLLAGYPANNVVFLNGAGAFTTPVAGVPGPHHLTHEPGGSDALVNAAWTNQSNIFTQLTPIDLSAANPRLRITETSRPANQQRWEMISQSAVLIIRAITDDTLTELSKPLSMDRAGNATIGNNLNVTGTGGNVACRDQANAFTQTQAIQYSAPRWSIVDTSQPANTKRFDLVNTAQTLYIQTLNDAGVFQANPVTVTRTGDVTVQRDVYEKGRVTPLGHWIDIPYSAGNFTSNAGSWTVPGQTTLAYQLVGKTMVLSFYMASTTIAGAPSELRIAIPPGFTNVRQMGGTFEMMQGGAPGTGWALSAGTIVKLFRDILGTAWTAGTVHVSGTVTFDI